MTRVLVTGAAGYIGSQLVTRLQSEPSYSVLASDVHFNTPSSNEKHYVCDIRRHKDVQQMFQEFKPHIVVHLASVVTPKKKDGRQFAYEVDVIGSKNILAACAKTGVERLIVTSSGAAYGYHPDNKVPLREDEPLRGNYEFAYSHHKRLVEELLEAHKKTKKNPEIVIFRVGTILGKNTSNQITALFERKAIPGIRGSDSPFVFIWDQDVIGAILLGCQRIKKGQFKAPAGIYNVAGDGWLTIDEIAKRLGKPVKRWPATFLKILFAVLKPLGLSRYGSEQVRFLQYRPVLDNSALKSKFGYTPQKTSKEAFEFFCKHR